MSLDFPKKMAPEQHKKIHTYLKDGLDVAETQMALEKAREKMKPVINTRENERE